jgi:CHAD domain-containing protein
MTVVERNIRSLFDKLNRQLNKLTTKRTPASVHRFRTSARRLEAAIAELAPDAGHNARKLLKLLARLRKKAGRVRDLDVQIALLRSLKMPEGARHKSQLLQTLLDERIRREKKLEQAFEKKPVRELKKRLKRAASQLDIRENELLEQAQNMLGKLQREPDPLTEKVLHQYRILGKRARYLAELADKNPQATELVNQLKFLQDALGEWHDWLKLTQRAENRFRSTSGSPLVSALRNLTRAKFRHAALALSEARGALSSKKPGSAEDAPVREQGASVTAIRAAA